MKDMHRFLAAGCLLSASLVASAEVADARSRDSAEYFFHQSFNDLKEEVELARKEGKVGLLVMFNDPDCPWCARMKSTVLNQVAVQDYYRQHFRLLHIDTRGDTVMKNFDGAEMAEKDFSLKIHRVRATPVFMFFDLEGQPVARYTGATRGVDEFMWLGEFVVSGAHKTGNFTRYKSTRAASQKGS